MTNKERTVVWFSCGVTSAVAAKLAVQQRENTVVAYCDTGSEHPDNARFLHDVAEWIEAPIHILKSEKYDNIWDVFRKTKYLVGVAGARCTTELKKKMRQQFQRPDDVHVFGFDTGELHRAERFNQTNPEIQTWYPLIDRGLSKPDCLAMLDEVGIELPEMYKLGYKNNNCIGCVKGQMGYWNKIRVDFPEVFNKMASVERELDVAINKEYKDGKRLRVFLDELQPGRGRYSAEPATGCGGVCGETLEEIMEYKPEDCEV
jgi:PP-loop superfamily ATP-utilizing enzyme